MIRSVAPTHGWKWIVAAFALFRRSPLIWLVLNLVLVVIAAVLGRVPVIGAYLLYLLTPLFIGGMMIAARDLEGGQDIEIAHLFRGFRHNASQLVTVGGVYLVGQVLISGLMLTLGGPEFQEAVQSGMSTMDPTKITPQVASRIMLALLVGMALFIPLAMAIWFAPALVIFDNESGFTAMIDSLRGSLRNIVPFLFYSIASSVLLLLAIIPFGLGLVLWIPVMLLTMYTSYRDVFAAAQPA